MIRFNPVFILMAAASLCSSGAAQPVQGDLVLSKFEYLSTTTDIYTVTWPAPTLKTLYTRTWKPGPLLTAYGNRFVYYAHLDKVSSLGISTKVTSISDNVSDYELDQDGTLMACDLDHKKPCLLRISGTMVATFCTLSTVHRFLHPICRDGDTGNWVVGTGNGGLLRVDRVTGDVTTIHSRPGVGISGVDFLPRTGDFAVIRDGYPSKEIAVIDRTGTVLHSLTGLSLGCLTVNHRTGRIFAAGLKTVHEFSSDLNIVNTRTYPIGGSLAQFYYLDIWDDRNVSVTASGEPATRAQVDLCFFQSRSQPYVVALSLSQRPGIAFGPDNVLNLAPDLLFLITAGGALPWWTEGFAGTLSSDQGTAIASFTIPIGLPPGTCIHVGAVAVNPAFPDGLDVGNVACVQVQ